MSIRTLIEINHDFSDGLDAEFLARLQRYARSGHRDDADMLSDMGVHVIADRHHEDEYRIPAGTPGFPSREVV